MASARLLKSLIKPVLQRHPNVIFFDNMLIFQPIGWYLRGCIFGRSNWTGGEVRFREPLRHSSLRAANTRCSWLGWPLAHTCW